MSSVGRLVSRVLMGATAIAAGVILAPRAQAPFVDAGSDVFAAGCRVYVTEMAGNAQHRVFIVGAPRDEQNAALIKGCRLVRKPAEADVTVMMVQSPSDATIKITQANFPRLFGFARNINDQIYSGH